MDHDAHLRKKFANVKHQRVKADETFAPTIEDETLEHLLAEPKNDGVTVDGGLDSNTAQGGGDELELGVLDGLLDEVEEVEDLHAADGLASPCEDFLLEFSFSGKACGLDYGPRGRSHSRNASSESQSPGLSGSSNSAVGISESSSVTIQESECKNESLDKTGTELRGTFRHKKKRKTQVRGSMCPASLDLQTPKQLDDDDDDPLLSSMLVKKYEKNSDEASKAGGSRREKRLRRPTQRYIEEVSDKKSKHHKGERKFTSIDVTGIKDRQLKVRSHAELNSIGPGMLSLVPEEELLNGTKIQVVSETRPRRGRPKKQISIVPPKRNEELLTSESDEDRVIRKRSDTHDRRKHQRMWTISEVTKLVDGISEYGVGRWTDIKRLLFASSAYRTPIDLRDKWRNLLRASSVQKLKKKEVEEKQSHAMRPLPKSLIRRVRELAKIHPYPRERGQKSIGQ
ncbi:hypothetical protein TIFTF001_008404 [Ficus carica]|uniref:Uncharacterized protein n=1 Tax=Ficus carica TaxID=3494 RepID=A0AA87ZUU0_FICCA|nr:hypothetical protein TIFTF001_008404 [Ficus carica]